MLLMKDRKQRLGQKKDAEEVLAHPFFAGLDLDTLLDRKIKAEFIPTLDQTGLNNFDRELTQEQPEESMIPHEIQRKIQEKEDNFKDFGFGKDSQDK